MTKRMGSEAAKAVVGASTVLCGGQKREETTRDDVHLRDSGRQYCQVLFVQALFDREHEAGGTMY